MAHDFSHLAATDPELVFLNHAAVAPLSVPARDALQAYTQQATSRSYYRGGWYQCINRGREVAARLINARGPDEIAWVPHTSYGLSTVARGLPWREGDDVVITGVEYPANRYPWQDLERLGVNLIEVPQHPDGRIDVEDVCNAITNRTRVVSISHVQYASGHRIDLQPIAETVHQVRGYLCVDAIQSVGVLPVDVQAMGIDFLSADGHKWMLGPEGAGLFYCHRDVAELVHPHVIGWLNVIDPDNYADYNFTLQPDARRFEAGTWNVGGLLALIASLEAMADVGIDAIWQRVDELTGRAAEGLSDRGYRVYSPRKHADERSGIVVFEPPEDGPTAEQVNQSLEEAGVVIALRGGRLRVSPHCTTSDDAIARFLNALP